MRIEVTHHHYFHMGVDDEVKKLLHSVISKLNIMGQNTDKALQDLQEIKTNLSKVSAESTTLLQKITDLENAAANADTPQSVLDAIADVKAQAKAVDDLVPDAPTEGGEEPQ